MIPDADIVWDKREQSRIEAQIKKQQELKLIGSMKKVPGHIYKERIVVEKDCYYEQALNVKNFVKRLKRKSYENT